MGPKGGKGGKTSTQCTENPLATNNSDIISEVPTNFEELLVILKSIQDSVSKTESKLDKLVEHIGVIEEKLCKSEERISEVEEKLVESEVKLMQVVSELDIVKANYEDVVKRLQFLEANANTVQQRFRIQSIRVYNMGREIKNSREAAQYLYDKLFKEIFSDANTGHHPGPFRVIEYCHLLPPMPGKEKSYAGFNYIVRFSSRFWKQLFFDSKRSTVDAYNSANNEKIKISHDYTHLNRVCLAKLHNDKLVKRVTFRGDRVMFKMDESGPWITVTNPHGATAADMYEAISE